MPDRAPRRIRSLLGPIVAGGALVGLLAAGWSGLWLTPPGGRLALVAAVASLPAVVRASGIRRSGLWATLLAVLGAIVALGAAAGTDPARVVRGDADTWSRLGDILPEGLGRAASIGLPLVPGRSEPLEGLMILILAGAAALVAWQAIVSRRPLAAVIVTATALAYRWTLVPPDHPVFSGVAVLVVALAALRLAGSTTSFSRPVPGRALASGTVITSLALVGSLGASRTSDAWWAWEQWTFGTGRPTTTLDTNQRYGPLVYPNDPRVIARVEADGPIPLRAITLDGFDGSAFVQIPQAPLSEEFVDGELQLPADTNGSPRETTQKITLTATASPWLLAGGRPVSVAGLAGRTITRFGDGSVRLQPRIGPDATYTVTTLIPDPGIVRLNRADAYDPVDVELLTMLLGGGQAAVTVPIWENGATELDPRVFGQYEEVYRLARQVVGDARTPYEAVNKVETFLRSPPFRYNEQTARPLDGSSDLVYFALTDRTGYCQHFAGTMALMLRMNGIPARVAVGFTSDSGRYDASKRSYEIIDRDAHSWVEVLLPGNGWIPFDPTPGRAVPNIASVSDPRYTISGLEQEGASQLATSPVRPPDRQEPLSQRPGEDVAPVPVAPDAGRPWWLLVPALAVLLGSIPLLTKAIRRHRRRRGDERAQVLGAARELESLCLDAGVTLDPAHTGSERAQAVWRQLGVDSRTLYARAREARFAPTPPPAGSGREAWRAFRAARAALGRRRRIRAAFRLRSLRAREGSPPARPRSVP